MIAADFEQGRIDARVIEELLLHPEIYRLSFVDCTFERETLSQLAQLPNLTVVVLDGSTWESESEFAAFVSTTQLETLQLMRAALSDDSLRAVDTSRLLSVLIEHCDGPTSGIVAELAAAPKLMSLNLAGIPFSHDFCRGLCAEKPEIRLTVDPADIDEFAPIVAAGATIALDLKAKVVGMRIDAHAAALPPGCLEPLANLEWLELTGSDVGPELLESVAELTELKSLSLERSRVSTAGLAKLQRSSQLSYLNLDGIAASSGEKVRLPSMPNLRHLQACSSAAADTWRVRIDLASLEFLSLGPGVSGQSLRQIAQLKKLRTLAVCGTTIDRVKSEALATLGQVSELLVFHCRVEEGSLVNAVEANGLTKLQVIGTDVSPELIAQLKTAAPSLTVVRW